MKAGIFSIGNEAYWPQFDGFLDKLNGYHKQIGDRISDMDIELVDAGMIDSPEKAGGAASLFRREEVELILSSSPPTHCLRRCCQLCRGPRCRWFC